MIRLVAIAILLACARPAHAETPTSDAHNNAVSLHLSALSAAVIAVDYERFVLPPRLSVAGTLGIRNAADHGDYQAQSMAIGVEARYWFTGQAVWNRKPVRNMVGPYAAFKLSLQGTTTQMGSETIGKTLTIGESLGAGYRFLVYRTIEVTPSLALALRSDLDLGGRLPSWHRTTVAFGLTTGVLF